MNELFENLAMLSGDELDEILDQRDSGMFDLAWCELNESVPELETRFDTKEVFTRLSKITSGHEICSYISDDLELIYKCDISKVESEFLNYLKDCYHKGIVPREWHC